MNEKNEEKKKFVVLKPEQKVEKLIAINNAAETIIENMKMYEEKANGIFNSFDSSGNLITMQTLQSKIKTAQSIIDEIKQIPQRSEYYDSKFHQNMNEQIQKETNNMISIIHKLKDEIDNGNVDIIPILQQIMNEYKEKTNKISKFFNSHEKFENKAKKNEIIYINIDDIYSRIGKLTEKLNDLEQYQMKYEKIENVEKCFVGHDDIQKLKHETAESKRKLDEIKIPVKKNQNNDSQNAVKNVNFSNAMNQDESELIKQEISNISRTLNQTDNKISILEERIDSINESSKVLRSLSQASENISLIKQKLIDMVENNDYLSKRSKEYDPDIQMRITKLQKNVDETIQHIKKNCKKPTAQHVSQYFKQMNEEMNSSAKTITNLHNNNKNGLITNVISKAFTDIQNQEKKIQKRIQYKEKNIDIAKRNAPLTDQNNQDLMKTINGSKNKTS